jgi:HUS1 checkpoint protein
MCADSSNLNLNSSRHIATPRAMKFRATLGDVGARWLDRFAPVFDRLGGEATLLLTPTTVRVVQSERVADGVAAHADFRVDEVFERCRISSACDDKIAVKLEPSALAGTVRGMIALEATRAECRLIKRRRSAASASAPCVNFKTTEASVEVERDVPVVGPLRGEEVRACEAAVEASVRDVGYWLECDRFALESLRECVERFARVSDVVEVTTTRQGALYMNASGGSVRALGMEYRGLRVLPEEADEYDEGAPEAGGVAARLAEIKSAAIGTSVTLSVKHLQRGFLGCASHPSTLLLGISHNANFFELVFRYGAQTEREGDSVGFMVRIPVVDAADGIE